jgi:hypothetical protein
MARGGSRAGAGRKAGAPNKATAQQREAIAASGLTPLDYMLSIMRDEENPKDMRLDAANKAAPYVHPKLASVEHSGPGGGPIEVANISDADLAAIIASGGGA